MLSAREFARVQQKTAKITKLLDGESMSLVSAILAESVARFFYQMDEPTAEDLFSVWSQLMWELCAEYRNAQRLKQLLESP